MEFPQGNPCKKVTIHTLFNILSQSLSVRTGILYETTALFPYVALNVEIDAFKLYCIEFLITFLLCCQKSESSLSGLLLDPILNICVSSFAKSTYASLVSADMSAKFNDS